MFWMKFKTIGHSLKNVGPSQETFHPSNILLIHSLQSHMSCSFRLAYQPRTSKRENWKAVENAFKIIKKLELLNSFQKFIFGQRSAPGACGPQGPPCYTTEPRQQNAAVHQQSSIISEMFV